MTFVRLPLPLRAYAGGKSTVAVEGSTVLDCIRELESGHPEISERLHDEDGDLSPAVNLYVNGQDVRHLSGLHTPVSQSDVITIVVAIAGG